MMYHRYTSATGALLGSYASDPRATGAGLTYNATTQGVSQQDIPAVTADMSWNAATRQYEIDPAKLEARLVVLIKSANEALVRAVYSQNYGKQKKYARKQQETLDFRALNGALGTPVSQALTATLSLFLPGFQALTLAQQKKKFRFSMAQAARRGVTVDVIIGEYETAIDAVEVKVANWEAVELEAIRAVKAATTPAAKQAAYDAINWNWTAP